MYGRGFNNNGFYGNGNYYSNGNCFGYGMFNNGWNIIILIGVLIIIALVTYFLVQNNKKRTINNNALENLKMKYIQGEITEEEYLKRKDILNR
jgi:putative membrane protein